MHSHISSSLRILYFTCNFPEVRLLLQLQRCQNQGVHVQVRGITSDLIIPFISTILINTIKNNHILGSSITGTYILYYRVSSSILGVRRKGRNTLKNAKIRTDNRSRQGWDMKA